MAVLELHNIYKSFGKKEVLKNVSFCLSTGEILGLYGRNGSGKSTLLKIMFGTLAASHGSNGSSGISMSVNNVPLDPKNVIDKKIIGYVPQDPFLPSQLKVRDLIPIYFSEEKKQDTLFYDPIMAQLAPKKANQLSMGERKYVEVMLVAHLEHPFLFLDEPFSMLEPLQIEHLKDTLKKLQTHKGIIITDHYYNDVFDITTQNMVMKDGIGIAIENKAELVTHNYLSR